MTDGLQASLQCSRDILGKGHITTVYGQNVNFPIMFSFPLSKFNAAAMFFQLILVAQRFRYFFPNHTITSPKITSPRFGIHISGSCKIYTEVIAINVHIFKTSKNVIRLNIIDISKGITMAFCQKKQITI